MAKLRTFLCSVASVVCSAAGALANADDLRDVMDAHWAFHLQQNPVFATSLGVRDYDDQLRDLSLAAMDARQDTYKSFLKRLDAIDPKTLTSAQALNRDLLAQDLSNEIEALSFPQRAMIFTRFYGWHMAMANLPESVPLVTVADYESYISRLNAFPAQNAQGIATTRTAIAQGMVYACQALDGYDNTIAAQITTQPERSRFWQPFKTRPNGISQQSWNTLIAAGRAAIADAVTPALRTWLDVFRNDYMNKCATDVGASALAQGETYYASRVKHYTTTDLSPREIHQTGLSEVSRIRREMQTIMDEVKFNGRFSEFQIFLRTDPRFYPKTGAELLEKTALIAKRADGALPKLFGVLPRMPYTVKVIPAEISEGNTTAYYEQPSGDGLRAGVYRVNTSALDQRPLYELEALTLHEAVPGHHLQIALQQEITDMPNFRRFGGYDAFVEGWGLYAERLGLEMGFYEDPYSNFGRLSYEMWRACRLVVDTGMHALGWSRQQAIDFMADNTALSETNITSEIDRYITWPGQALAYKIGEMKIRDLRKTAAQALGAQFDVRRFHDALLAQGALPLNLLEDHMHRWIRSQGGILPEPRQQKSGNRRPERGDSDRRPRRQQ